MDWRDKMSFTHGWDTLVEFGVPSFGNSLGGVLSSFSLMLFEL